MNYLLKTKNIRNLKKIKLIRVYSFFIPVQLQLSQFSPHCSLLPQPIPPIPTVIPPPPFVLVDGYFIRAL